MKVRSSLVVAAALAFPPIVGAAVPLYAQCGGKNYGGAVDCVLGTVCTYFNDWYSQCIIVPGSSGVPLWGQCGGLYYTGKTECSPGVICVYLNDWYSQCRMVPGETRDLIPVTEVTATPPASSSPLSTTVISETITSETATTSTMASETATSEVATSETATSGSITSEVTSATSLSDTVASSTATSSASQTSSTSTPSDVPAGAITVDQNGSGMYINITAALADTSSNIIYVYPGNYTEQVVISRENITIVGQTSDKLSYDSNTVTVSRNVYAGLAGSNDLSGTVRILAPGVKLYNLNIENTFGKPIDQAQAIALSVQNGSFACYVCQLRGYQDTLLANRGTQFYGKSLIQGSVDFIFGQQASIWVTGGTINTVGNGYITASGRSTDDANYYVIDHTSIVGTGSVYLGRPWRNYARVIFQNSDIGSQVYPAGWRIWSDADTRTNMTLFGEYNNTGVGAWNSSRAPFAVQLTEAVNITTVLGSTDWIDSAYL